MDGKKHVHCFKIHVGSYFTDGFGSFTKTLKLTKTQNGNIFCNVVFFEIHMFVGNLLKKQIYYGFFFRSPKLEYVHRVNILLFVIF